LDGLEGNRAFVVSTVRIVLQVLAITRLLNMAIFPSNPSNPTDQSESDAAAKISARALLKRFLRLYQSNNTQRKVRVAREEWDFSRVPKNEARACCFYEYARESTYVMQNLENPPPYDQIDERGQQLLKNPLTIALPPTRAHARRGPGETQKFNKPWLLRDPSWRAWFCRELPDHWDGVLEKTQTHSFQVLRAEPCIRWTGEDIRGLDRKTGLEVLFVIIDWAAFDDGEIGAQFKKWLKKGRPKAVGLHSKKGTGKANEWQMHLEKLAILRLRHHYLVDEFSFHIPAKWNRDKFVDVSEINRACNAARKQLHDLFPFLQKNAQPLSWKRFDHQF
jgi:hypothetical protein